MTARIRRKPDNAQHAWSQNGQTFRSNDGHPLPSNGQCRFPARFRRISFSRTCRAYRAAYLFHIFSKCKTSIAEFDLDPESLMTMLVKTRGIIIGSVPLYVLTGEESVAKNLDILVPASSEATMKIFLRSEFGYSITDTNLHHGAHGTLRMEYTYQKRRHTIMLRVATGENPLVPLMLSESTLTMNFISPWGLFCAYPQLTLRRRGLLNHFTEDEHDAKSSKTYLRVTNTFNKYQKEGFDLRPNPSAWCGHWVEVFATIRCCITKHSRRVNEYIQGTRKRQRQGQVQREKEQRKDKEGRFKRGRMTRIVRSKIPAKLEKKRSSGCQAKREAQGVKEQTYVNIGFFRINITSRSGILSNAQPNHVSNADHTDDKRWPAGRKARSSL
ncbi:hypothetical protein C8F04DRAFT_1188798 [Mycena alexandri]|uniref:Uncharacterized protein n=1 Tax=Mycena alexandri TaxID=1745969 RepID=A0AAD6SIS7_9AGAR|nr:hypothetical protein C8F04DRAFT_1188798 [Mycena alexandri]